MNAFREMDGEKTALVFLSLSPSYLSFPSLSLSFARSISLSLSRNSGAYTVNIRRSFPYFPCTLLTNECMRECTFGSPLTNLPRQGRRYRFHYAREILPCANDLAIFLFSLFPARGSILKARGAMIFGQVARFPFSRCRDYDDVILVDVAYA